MTEIEGLSDVDGGKEGRWMAREWREMKGGKDG